MPLVKAPLSLASLPGSRNGQSGHLRAPPRCAGHPSRAGDGPEDVPPRSYQASPASLAHNASPRSLPERTREQVAGYFHARAPTSGLRHHLPSPPPPSHQIRSTKSLPPLSPPQSSIISSISLQPPTVTPQNNPTKNTQEQTQLPSRPDQIKENPAPTRHPSLHHPSQHPHNQPTNNPHTPRIVHSILHGVAWVCS